MEAVRIFHLVMVLFALGMHSPDPVAYSPACIVPVYAPFLYRKTSITIIIKRWFFANSRRDTVYSIFVLICDKLSHKRMEMSLFMQGGKHKSEYKTAI